MKMKKIYIILWAKKECLQGYFNVSEVQFVFTSKKAAMKQMDDIAAMIENGQWWTDVYGKPMYGKVLSDDVIKNCFIYDEQRDLVYEDPNKNTCLYRLICRANLNSSIEL